METLTSTGIIDRRNTMYPSMLEYVTDNTIETHPYSTSYGFVLTGTAVYNGVTVSSQKWFSIANETSTQITVSGKTIIITRLGFIGQNTMGGPLEKTGRLTYIDGCSDSLLVYPPRLGDASLNALYFPESINQTFHIHPSIRMGIVAKGSGICDLKGRTIPLTEGTAFCLDSMELHRFKTTDSKMVVIAYHPDGDWGPTDHNHIMINRTYME